MRPIAILLRAGVAAAAFGPELVTNGTFDTDTSGWTATACALSVVAQRLRVASLATGTVNRYGYQAITTEIGATYRVSLGFMAASVGSPTTIRLRVGSSAGASTFLSMTGAGTATFVATGTTTYISAYFQGSTTIGDAADYDTISVKKVL